METVVYVDVLLVLNYVINTMLILCMCKLAGRTPRRCRIVAAALIGSAGSLTIFLPYIGFWSSIASKFGISAIIVLVACKFVNWRAYCRELFLFFAVSFFFAGVMLAIWMFLAPGGMFYHNGVVYFDISSASLVAVTVVAYLLLSAANRISHRSRPGQQLYAVRIHFRGRIAEVTGLMDTGNSLYEPFSGTPVMVCGVAELEPVLPAELAGTIRAGAFPDGTRCGVALRLIPYENVGKRGTLPAFRPDKVELEYAGESWQVERVYVGIAPHRIGEGRYNAILNPDLAGIKLLDGGKV